MQNLSPEIVEKISYFTNYFAEDKLYKFIENHGLLNELLSPESEFIKSIRLGEKYKNEEAAILVEASSGQRVLNIINDERDFNKYLEASKIGGKLYLHDDIVLFKLRMIFFLLGKNFKLNEIAHLLGLVNATYVKPENGIGNKEPEPEVSEARILAILHKELLPFIQALDKKQDEFLQGARQELMGDFKNELRRDFSNEQALVDRKINLSIETVILTKEIETDREKIRQLEKELDKLNNKSLRLNQDLKSYETRIESIKNVSGLKKLFGGSNESLKELLVESRDRALEEIDFNSSNTKKLIEELGSVRERVRKKTSELNMLLEQKQKLESSDLLLDTPLLNQTISNVLEISTESLSKKMSKPLDGDLTTEDDVLGTTLLEVAATNIEEK